VGGVSGCALIYVNVYICMERPQGEREVEKKGERENFDVILE
jgi:hypothetical protein